MTVRRRWVAMVGAGLVAALALAGCAAGDDGGGEADQAPEAAGAEAAPEPPRGPADEAGSGEADAGQPGEEGDSGGAGGELVDVRAIIFTGGITVRVADVDEAADGASALADRYGGFVGGDRRTVDEDRSVATMVLRIPSENFTAAVGDLGRLGEEESREIETEDVTAEVVDLETRIATAEASVERTRALLERAESISEIVSVEAELSQREANLAQLQARQRALADLTTLSTITVRLLGPEAEQPEPEPENETGFLAGLSAGWNAFTTSTRVVVTVFGALLPFLVVIGVPATAAVWWARRRRGSRVTGPEPVAAAPESAPGA